MSGISYPVGSLTVTYQDAQNKVATSRAQNSCGESQAVGQETGFDGLGNAVSGKATDAEGDILSSTERDVLGRVVRAVRPRRTAEGEAVVVTEYDGLGRPVRVVLEDGSVQTTRYAVNQTTVTDPAGKWTAQVVDSLGRLTSAIEPGTATVPQSTTTYDYDLMDRLTGVAQSGQVRTFQYDSLGRLTCASNPESRSGTTSCAGRRFRPRGFWFTLMTTPGT